MQAHLGPNRTPQRYSTNFIEWDDTPSFASSLSQFSQRLDSATHPSAARVSALRRLLRDAGPATLADAMGLNLDPPTRDRFEPEHAVAASSHDGDTVPSALMALMPSTPFREPLSGLAVREVLDADVFRHFFGR